MCNFKQSLRKILRDVTHSIIFLQHTYYFGQLIQSSSSHLSLEQMMQKYQSLALKSSNFKNKRQTYLLCIEVRREASQEYDITVQVFCNAKFQFPLSLPSWMSSKGDQSELLVYSMNLEKNAKHKSLASRLSFLNNIFY